MYAIVEVKGKQYKVEKGQNILIEYLGEDVKKSPEIKTLLLKKDDETVVVGTPYVENVKVSSKIVESLKGDKVIIGKHKRRKDYRRKTGHRHKYHKITIEDIIVWFMASLVNVRYNSDGIIEYISVDGHAGVKKVGEGYEVCIALSSITQAMSRALISKVGKRHLIYKIDNANLSLRLKDFDKLEESKKKEYKIVSEGYLIGIKELIKEYPDYIKYKEER